MSPGLPVWVRKADGRLVPFDADRICQALFAATERLGRPDAFLARELTDGVLYFLAEERPGSVAAADWVRETVAKVVSQLRHADLAHAFETLDRESKTPEVRFSFSPLDPPTVVARACLTEWALNAVYSRDLAALHRDGLLTLLGLDAPLELAACVAPAGPAGVVALDGPEHAPSPGGLPARPRLIANLNVPSPPPWAEAADGPLFAGLAEAQPTGRTEAALDAILEGCLHKGERLRIDWHLGERDFLAEPGGPQRQRLARVARAALEGGPVAFVLQRPRRPVPLGPGLDRRRPAALLAIALHLPRLAELPRVHNDPELFLKKLASLARLALSAAVQKRAALRRHRDEPGTAALGRGFLLDRACLVVAPVGLEAAVRALLGRGLCDDADGLEFARRIIAGLREVLAQDGRGALVESSLDTPWGLRLEGVTPLESGGEIAGVTPWDASAAPRSQLRAAGVLHGAAQSGTAALLLPWDHSVSAEEVLNLLEHAWRRTDVVRLQLVRTGQRRQARLPGL